MKGDGTIIKHSSKSAQHFINGFIRFMHRIDTIYRTPDSLKGQRDSVQNFDILWGGKGDHRPGVN